jgi:sirohydrochlorin ferrochelatase
MLILVAHGTRSAAGVAMIEQLRRAVSARIGPVATSVVDVLGPNPAEVLAGAKEAAVVVPAFLASGYHVRDDLPARIAESGHHDVTLRPALGPDPVLAKVMHDRLREVGWRPGDAVVMAAAGSSDPMAQHEVACAGELLARRVGRIHVGYVATGTPRVDELVDGLRSAGRRRVFIASYLLAPGLFHDRLTGCGATAVTAPLGVHPGIVDLVVARFLRRDPHQRGRFSHFVAPASVSPSEDVAHVA